MTSAKDCADFSETLEYRVFESHPDKLPKPDKLYIRMTRSERRVRESFNKAFGSIRSVVIDVDGEKHEYDADTLIALLEEFEVRDASAVRLAERLRGIADEMRNVGASTMTPHELLACYASDVDKVADSLMYGTRIFHKA
ncbi:MAG: hypothetical protein J6S63_06755 [Atopobiaceae bacterium]|nr:hypothetical protein [Atopobiaceae bacterium]